MAGPVIVGLIVSSPGDAYLVAALLFGLASATDLVDGRLARHDRAAEAPLGIFLDTTADKILVSLVLIGLSVAGLIALWIPLVIVGREFLISGLRSFAASYGRVISARAWGKGKAALTMIAIFFLLVAADGRIGGLGGIGSEGLWRTLFTLSGWLMVVAAVLTVISGLRYVLDAWPLLQESERAETVRIPRRRRRRDAVSTASRK